MNMDTVLKCAQIAADHRRAALGYVDEDIAELLAELTAPVVEPAPVVVTEAVVEATVETAPAE